MYAMHKIWRVWQRRNTAIVNLRPPTNQGLPIEVIEMVVGPTPTIERFEPNIIVRFWGRSFGCKRALHCIEVYPESRYLTRLSPFVSSPVD
jgi:hypothetical protein